MQVLDIPGYFDHIILRKFAKGVRGTSTRKHQPSLRQLIEH
ncbi:hypothetical protein PLANTIT3_90188 [Plantibacter sp. T3]|nr:hypothetical protein PLANTIT3_90188 [Plantibacter sp. T3]